MTLARQVARVTRTAFLVVAVAAVINLAMFAYLNLYLDSQEERATDAGRETRLAHLAMLDQETGLRAYLITAQAETLRPYLEGRNEVVQRLDVRVGQQRRQDRRLGGQVGGERTAARVRHRGTAPVRRLPSARAPNGVRSSCARPGARPKTPTRPSSPRRARSSCR